MSVYGVNLLPLQKNWTYSGVCKISHYRFPIVAIFINVAIGISIAAFEEACSRSIAAFKGSIVAFSNATI